MDRFKTVEWYFYGPAMNGLWPDEIQLTATTTTTTAAAAQTFSGLPDKQTNEMSAWSKKDQELKGSKEVKLKGGHGHFKAGSKKKPIAPH